MDWNVPLDYWNGLLEHWNGLLDYWIGYLSHEMFGGGGGGSLNAGLDSSLECGTGTWDWIIKLDCGTVLAPEPMLAGTDNKSR